MANVGRQISGSAAACAAFGPERRILQGFQPMIDAALQRKNMVESQVRPSDVTDRRVIRAMLETPREEFVPGGMKALAYMDTEIGLDGTQSGRAMMAPRVFSKLVQLANLDKGDVVLDVGAGSGYSSAVIAKIAETVVALEADAGLADAAAAAVQKLGLDNIAVVKGALNAGYASEGPYDAIILEGMVPKVPQALLEQLKDGARLVAVVGEGPLGKAVVGRTACMSV